MTAEENSDKSVKCYQSGDGSWQVTKDQVWVCGAYTTRAAAARAPFVDVSLLAEVWDRKKPEAITEAEVEALVALPPVVVLATRWRWSHIYERVEKARRDGEIITQPLAKPTFGIDEGGREELRAWVIEWLAGYVEASTSREELRARVTGWLAGYFSASGVSGGAEASTYPGTPIEIRERGSIIYSLAAVLRLGDMPSQSGTSAAHELLRESTGRSW